jgi:hypothetical protein
MKELLLKTPERILEMLKKCWSLETSSRYTPENPSRGQCGVTSLVIHDHFGGEIVKTKVGEVWHFYNFIAGNYYDFTSQQFSTPLEYDYIVTNRAEALDDTDETQYNILSRRFQAILEQVVSQIT